MRTPVPLRRNHRFQLLWVGAAAANLSLEVVEVAYPLLILALTGSPALAGLFGFVQVGTIILVGLPAGVLIDRWDRRRVLLIAEAVRALAIGAIVAGLVAGVLTIAYLLVVAVVLGMASAFGATARMLMIRAVVPDEQLTTALSQDEVRGGVAALAGPPLGGALFVAARAFPFVTAIAGFAISFVCALIVKIPAVEHRDQTIRSAWAPITTAFTGIRELVADRLLRAALALVSIFYFSVTAGILIVVYSMQRQGAPASHIGFAVSGTAIGMLLGAVGVPRLTKVVRPGAILLTASALTTVAVGLLALPYGAVWVFAMLFVAALGLPALKILVDILIFRQTPDHRRGRAISATFTLIGVGSPLGSLVGGLALQVAGVTGAVLLIAGIQAVITVAGLANRHVTAARWPS
ncbi:MFS transporter [Actinoplanes sp. NPDC051346]|uniref:MFS transporter n=1 Tax=Actinoplanes sp. NPDC051346 TaxID=3155048 RepID=UPI0034431ADD